jgi:hypothetical protein
MGSLHDAVASFEFADLKEKRRRALSLALKSRGLVVEVTVLDDRCAAFIEGNLNTTAEEICNFAGGAQVTLECFANSFECA